jgi:small subunit ribosomal protein S4
VNHGHILVNGKPVDIASFRVRVGHEIAVKPASHQSQMVVSGLEIATRRSWEDTWLDVNKDARQVKLVRLPDETATPFSVNVQLVIEFYALSA